ncbi:GDP/UDP-N,N'-diacetylbacillosamine 2-epimerase (hydrolysing) [Algoriphagus faecimaris]|uniref:GDP/UDP-N,N'-diacetylbacillosamine 2-epimerase (Hydrolysing) n=1 Tax=Algoriphagus faecimaris TaxID=686796 RepID=A0A1G6PWN5_9BACT|nr:UDP-N-acetylglucosamine 2-epimerase [Algoriphagus faecimaris]SDC84529.1 GDP/UDP-N,N'-diacetylbacillosamine 2-epimerase (hydrolysing) [Algoriphagus faecimaris]
MIRIGILTSSRADYGIYLPLLKAMEQDEEISFKIIVFGTHLSKLHGYTLAQIESDGFNVFRKIESLLLGDSPNAVASGYALTALKFSEFWEENHQEFEVVFALGDRFEMAAAVAASVPFQVKIAHLHGGETTLGAIDNIYRHSISLSSNLHFVSTDAFRNRLIQLLDNNNAEIFNVGSLSLENLATIRLLSPDEFEKKWKIDLHLGTILVTVHPETVAFDLNEKYCKEVCLALEQLSVNYQVVITMPNPDTAGMVYRLAFEELRKKQEKIKIIENFGTQSYFTCMKYSKLMIGNTSSGIIEAATFQKYVINLGDRQKGRLAGENVLHLPFDSYQIVKKAKVFSQKQFEGTNPYYQPNPSQTILGILKETYANFS